MITPADSKAIVPAIEKARQAGVTVIALDTPTEPGSAVDALFATNNQQAGELIGRYAKAKVEERGIEPRIAMLDLSPGITSGELRRQGFLKGFGGTPEIVGSVDTLGETARAADGPARAAGEGRRHQRRLHRQRARGLRRRAGPQGRRHRATTT